MALQKTYRYEISRDGIFLGILPNVTSPFSINQGIGTAGAQLIISVGQNVDISPLAPDPILDETGDPILDETGGQILAERHQDLVGNVDPGILISNDNGIVVYEMSSYNPSGKVVFSGYISKWKGIFGGDGDIVITCLNNGQDLGNYLIPGSAANVVDQSNNTKNDFFGTGVFTGTYGGTSFVTGIGVNNVAAVLVRLAMAISPQLITLSLWNSVTDAAAGVAPLASASQMVSSATDADYLFTFPVPVPVSAGTSYFFGVGPLDNSYMYIDDGASYANGTMYIFQVPNNILTDTAQDLYFKTYTSANTTSYPFTSADPSTILTTIMAAYKTYGGQVNTETYNPTGVSTNYTFKINTILEGIQKVADLGPANWYWYVDAATNTLHYKPANTVADHTLIKGRHVNELEIEATKEGIANVVYFSGGDDGTGLGTTVFVKEIDTESILNSRVGLARISDNRVSGLDGASTGQQLAQNYIDQRDQETYITSVSIPHSVYDISTFQLGQMVGFSGYGTFPDSLLLQIVAINYTPDMVTLTLGSPSIRNSKVVDDIQKQLSDLQTIDNPNAPS